MTDQQVTPPHTIPHTAERPLIVPVGANDEAAQREWEHEQVQRGVERYRASLQRIADDGSVTRRSLAELEPGQIIAQELIGPLVERVRGAQQVALQTLAETQRPTDDYWGLTLLPAETLAAITVLHALSRAESGPLTSTAIALGTRVQHEWDYLRWKTAEASAEKERKERGAEDTPNLFKLMHHRNKDGVNERVYAKWRKKAPLFSSGDWTPATKTYIGTALLTLLVESNAWFEVVMERLVGTPRQVRVFRMTELALSWVADRHSQNELLRPYMLPMICEPRDFEYREVA